MKAISHFFAAILLIIAQSCSKQKALPQKTICGTPGWPQGTWKVKFLVTAVQTADSIIFDINNGSLNSGTPYHKKFISPALPLTDSTVFCGDVNSDINLYVYNNDTIKQYSAKIFVMDTLQNQTSGTSFHLVGQCK